MNPEDAVLEKGANFKIMHCSQEVSGILRFIEMESRTGVPGRQGSGGMGACYIRDLESLLEKIES